MPTVSSLGIKTNRKHRMPWHPRTQTVYAVLRSLIERVVPPMNLDGTPNAANQDLHNQLDKLTEGGPVLVANGAYEVALAAWCAVEQGTAVARLSAAHTAIKACVVVLSDEAQTIFRMRSGDRRLAEAQSDLLNALMSVTLCYPSHPNNGRSIHVEKHLDKLREQVAAVETELNETLSRIRHFDAVLNRELRK